MPDKAESLYATIRRNDPARRALIRTPFGRRLVCYADLTATGRHLDFVESFFRRIVPFYANTHTSVSTTGRIMTELREQARGAIRKALDAGDEDEVLFVGSGATAAINKLVGLLGIRIPEPLEREFRLSETIPRSARPVVFVGPYEHHSNLLPWVESLAQVVEIGFSERSGVDLGELEGRLREFRDRPLKIGSFSAASNVTGILTDVHRIARVLHQGGAYAVFDYAAAGPYVPIDMHPGDPLERLDAVLLSTHKFIGGPQGSGVLAASRELFRSRVPERPGGGTVDYVASFDGVSVDYSARLQEREEGGTPSIVGDLRAGAAFLVKEMLGPSEIRRHEILMARRAWDRLARHPKIRLLGPADPERLAILSFNIERLHHDLVSALLDHLFGIQNRAGCSCAGPYGHRLLGIDSGRSEAFRRQIARGVGGIKPGWVRLSIPYYASREDMEFILRAVEFTADHGRDFLPCYRLGWKSGIWRHSGESQEPDLVASLSVESLTRPDSPDAAGPLDESELRSERARYFAEAESWARKFRAELPCVLNPPMGDPEVDRLVWFDYVHSDPDR